MTATTGRITRVIGWYHSHPHITVMPSHVGKGIIRIYVHWLVVFVEGRGIIYGATLD
jgi:proteasome lid subunit RPN8/RPN11